MKRNGRFLRAVCVIAISIMLVCCSAAAASADEIVAPYDEDGAEGRIARLLADQLNLPVNLTGNGTSDEAANRMLSEPGVFLLDSQAAPIAGLQGYTDEDLRTEMVPVCVVAESPLYIVMDAHKAEEYGISDAETLASYISEHEYELTFARHIGADVIDRAVTLLGNNIAVLTDYFMPEEIPEILHTGGADGTVMTGAELANNADELLILCCLGENRSEAFPDVSCAAEAGFPVCRGETMWIFTSVKTDSDLIEQYARKISEAELELPDGFERRNLTGDALQEDLQTLFADLKSYMTSEGLFFYEE